MTKSNDLGHEPEETHDKEFAPVNRGSDARGRTLPAEDAASQEKREMTRSGTGVPGVANLDPESLPANEWGVEAAEEQDATREHPRR
jgi:hypothetical protein